MTLPIMRSRQTAAVKAVQITDHPLIVHFLPSPCWLSLTLCLPLMNSGSHAINSMRTMTPPPPFSSYPQYTYSLSPSVSHFFPSAVIKSGNLCATVERKTGGQARLLSVPVEGYSYHSIVRVQEVLRKHTDTKAQYAHNMLSCATWRHAKEEMINKKSRSCFERI